MEHESKSQKECCPFRQGLFVEESGRAFLTGNRCKACGRVFFPASAFCFGCYCDEMSPVRLGNRGTLYSYTVSHMASADFLPPYTVGWIELEEGIRVFAPIKAGDDQTIYIGMEMELVIEDLWEEADKRIVGYKFSPVYEEPGADA